MKDRLHYADIEELARIVCGVDDDADIDEAIYQKFDLGLEDFGNLVEALLPFTPVVQSALGYERYHAFVKDGAMIARKKVKSE